MCWLGVIDACRDDDVLQVVHTTTDAGDTATATDTTDPATDPATDTGPDAEPRLLLCRPGCHRM